MKLGQPKTAVISIIIPTQNEAHCLPVTLDAISAAGIDRPHEILVVDAESSDRTVDLATLHGARVIPSATRQRAAQMNLGATQALSDILLFLHADTILPECALARIQCALNDARVVGGAFARRYDSNSRWLRVTCALAEIRGRSSGWFLGDQAIFVRADVFREMGGFKDFAIFEDLDFSRRLRVLGRTVILRPAVTSAARRFETGGPCRTTWSDFLLTCRYLRGVSPQELANDPASPPRIESTSPGGNTAPAK